MGRKKRKILVVDDDKAVRQSLRRILEMKGYIVNTANTGIEALEKSTNKHYDLLLLNYRLPDMTSKQLQTTVVTNTPELKIGIMEAKYFKPDNLPKTIKEKLQE